MSLRNERVRKELMRDISEILRKEVGLDCDTIVKQTISDYLMIKDR